MRYRPPSISERGYGIAMTIPDRFGEDLMNTLR
jgi:hypothetical protein